MKRAALLFLALFFFSSDSFSSGPAKRKKSSDGVFQQGQNSFHTGVGFVTMVYPATDSLLFFGEVKRKNSLPISLRYEYAITNNIGAGLMLSYHTSKITITDNTDPDNVNGLNYKFFFFGARGAWHQSLGIDKLDAYGAVTLGFTSASNKPFGINSVFPTYTKGFTWCLNVGANFYFTDNIGAFAELGYGITLASAGISLKF